MPDETDAEKIFTAFPLENWRRPSGYPRTTCIKTIHQDLKSNNLSLNEATDVAQNRPLWRLMSAFGGWYTLLVVHARNERMNYLKVRMQIFSLSDQKLFCLNFRFLSSKRPLSEETDNSFSKVNTNQLLPCKRK